MNAIRSTILLVLILLSVNASAQSRQLLDTIDFSHVRMVRIYDPSSLYGKPDSIVSDMTGDIIDTAIIKPLLQRSYATGGRYYPFMYDAPIIAILYMDSGMRKILISDHSFMDVRCNHYYFFYEKEKIVWQAFWAERLKATRRKAMKNTIH